MATKDKTDKMPGLKALDWIIAAALGAMAAILYLCSLAGYAYPGESAHLSAVWRGLDTSSATLYPLMKGFAGLFGYGNAIAPFCGTVAVISLFLFVVYFVRVRIGGEDLDAHALSASRLGGAVAAIVFMLTPAVREAASHLEPRMFDTAWALLMFILLIPYARVSRFVAWLFPILIGVMGGFGLADTPLFLFILPLTFSAVWLVSRKRGERGYAAAALSLFAFLVTFAIYVPCVAGDFGGLLQSLVSAARAYTLPKGWLFVMLFATLPFLVSLFSSVRAFNERSGWTQWFFHLAMTFVTILAIATPLAPSSLMQGSGVLPVAASAFAAFTAGYLAVYWWLQTKVRARVNESTPVSDSTLGLGRGIALVAGGVLSVTILFTLLLNLFSFDRNAGAFADKIADRVLADLGDRTWFITDGTLDDHLRFAAQRQGRELNLVCLQRDLDKKYLSELGELVKAKKVGGIRNGDLCISLSLGVLTFVQDWFSVDPEAAKSVAVFGAPDLWYAAKIKPVPEFLFFGADPARVPDWKSWEEFRDLLKAPKGWGSYRLMQEKSPVLRMRLNLRRHLGLIANDRGVWLQDEGRDDEAFELYDLVLSDIDADNVCALFNEFELARKGQRKAAAKKVELERKLKAIVDDADRRYRLWALANYYGYIRSPEIFIRLGFAWARSGRAGEALQQIRRAIDFIPTDNRNALMNMMAALYASENDQRKSREMYEAVLAKDADNHDALVGLMRLELMDGNSDKAREYLEKATAAAGDDPRVRLELALLHMMKGELTDARDVLRKVTDADHGNLQAWSLLAAVTIQQIDAAKDDAEKKNLTKYLEDVILTTMEKQSRSSSDYYLQTTRAFVLLRKGEEKRREARDAFVAAAKDRPDIGATSEIILGLDIALNDTEDAERQAREVLRRNRKAPLANYVMGSLALQNGRYVEAETFLRRAVDAPKPVVLALNDLAEVLRRNKNFEEAERFARQATETDPKLYVAWETLGSILLDANRNLDEAETCVTRACELSRSKDGREADVRMLISLARVQIARGDTARGKGTLRKVNARIGELSEFERKEFEELRKSAR